MNPPPPLELFGDPHHPDTICGIATPLGQGGLGIIRVSGPEALTIADRVFHGKHPPTKTASHRILHGRFADPAVGDEIDEVLLSIFRAPNSYTGEDVTEFSFHGSPAVLSRALSVLTSQGLRIAGPGEFTFRAFCNGRIDLTQAEAVAELVGAKSEKSAEAAYRQLNGSLKELIGQLRAKIIEALAWLEMSSDFVEEDIEFKKAEEITHEFSAILEHLATLKQAYQRSRIVRDGLTVTIIGAPNVGKSSIFNRLLARERSIVTTMPGTTRDAIDEYIILAGYPVRLVDTAGIRRTEDVVETIGIDRTIGHLEDSDLVFWVLDGSAGFTAADADIQETIGKRPLLVLINKADIGASEKISQCSSAIKSNESLVVSATTGKGLEELTNWLINNYLRLSSDRPEYPFIINCRHVAALGPAEEHLHLAQQALARRESYEFAAFDARKAADYLGEITGETTPDDVLNKIFADFCIGK